MGLLGNSLPAREKHKATVLLRGTFSSVLSGARVRSGATSRTAYRGGVRGAQGCLRVANIGATNLVASAPPMKLLTDPNRPPAGAGSNQIDLPLVGLSMNQDPNDPLVVAIDDFASETQVSEGWSYVVLEAPLAEQFDLETKKLLSTSKLSAFKGNDYKRKKKEAYVEFLSILVDLLERSDRGFVVCTLLDETWKATYDAHVAAAASGLLARIGIVDEVVLHAANRLMRPLYTFLRLADGLGGTFRVELDSEKATTTIGDMQVAYGGTHLSASIVMEKLVNAYASKVSPGAPRIERGGLRVVRDEESAMVQAADLIANLSAAFVRSRLGDQSKTLTEKASVFLQAFGTILPSPIPSFEELQLDSGHGRGEIRLPAGSFTFWISSQDE